jgi:hypothetical protein
VDESIIPDGLTTVEDAKLHKDGTIKTFFNFQGRVAASEGR